MGTFFVRLTRLLDYANGEMQREEAKGGGEDQMRGEEATGHLKVT